MKKKHVHVFMLRMINCRGLLAAMIMMPALLAAQSPNWTFEGGTGSANADIGKGVAVDAAGNVYVTGSFSNTDDFDFGAGVANLTSLGNNDIVIASYTSAGAYRWAVRAGGVVNDNASPAGAIVTDGTNVYVTGSYNGASTAFGATLLTPTGGSGVDSFVAKLNAANGAWIWAVGFGGTGSTDFGTGITLDGAGNPYVLGQYNNTLTKDGCTATTGGGSELYVMKLNPASGACTWLASGGSSMNDVVAGGGICYDPVTTKLVVASNFNGATATYGTFTLPNAGANDVSILELNSSSGAFISAVGAGTVNQDDAIACAYDAVSGGVYIVGEFNGASITLPGGIVLNNAGNNDAWVGRYSETSHAFTWAKSGGGAGADRANSVAVDPTGNVLVAGSYASNPAVFGALSLTNTNSSAFDDVFVVDYGGAAGTELWAAKNTNTGVQPSINSARYIAQQPGTGNFWITGQYAQGCAFGALGPMNSNGFNDFFVARFTEPPPLSATQSQTNLTCNGVCTGSATVVASGGSAPYTYSWSPSGGTGATASSLCATSYSCTITDATSAQVVKNFTLTQPAFLSVAAASQTNVNCASSTSGAASVTASGGTGTLTYNWTPGNPTGDGTASVTGLTVGSWTCTVTDANSCATPRVFTITQLPATLTASAGAGGTIAPTGTVNVTCGGGQSFTIAPTVGDVINDVLVDAASVGAVPNYSFTNLLANHTIAASFRAIPGEVPDRLSLGTPLRIAKNSVTPANLDLSWGDGCGAAQTDFAVYEGTIGTWYSHASRLCTTGGGFTANNFVPAVASRYYLVVPVSATKEGSYGTRSTGAQIPQGTGACFPTQDTATCP